MRFNVFNVAVVATILATQCQAIKLEEPQVTKELAQTEMETPTMIVAAQTGSNAL